MEAGRTLAQLLHLEVPTVSVKTVRMQELPSIGELCGELKALVKMLPQLCSSHGNLSCSMTRRDGADARTFDALQSRHEQASMCVSALETSKQSGIATSELALGAGSEDAQTAQNAWRIATKQFPQEETSEATLVGEVETASAADDETVTASDLESE